MNSSFYCRPELTLPHNRRALTESDLTQSVDDAAMFAGQSAASAEVAQAAAAEVVGSVSGAQESATAAAASEASAFESEVRASESAVDAQAYMASAWSARNEAVEAAERAEAVPATTDGLMTAIQADEDSQFARDQRDKIGAVASVVATPRTIPAATRAAVRPLLGKLDRGYADANLLIGPADSISNGPDEWAYLLVLWLAEQRPAWSVIYHLVDPVSGTAWQAAQTIQTGLGPRTLHIWNYSISGAAIADAMPVARWNLLVATKPDLTLISLGMNHGAPTDHDVQRHAFSNFLEEFVVRLPDTGVCLIAQNPTTQAGREDWQAQKAQIIEQYAAMRGFGFIDVHQAFIDYAIANGVTVNSLLFDTIHPTPAAQAAIFFPTVAAAFTGGAEAGMPTRGISPLLTPSRSLLGTNGDFAAWTGALPDGAWALIGTPTVEKDTVNVETGQWSMKITPPAGAGESGVQIGGSPTALGIRGIAGQAVTLVARAFAAEGSVSASVAIQDQRGGSTQSRADFSGFGRFTWVAVTRRLVTPTTALVFKLDARISGSGVNPVSFDRAYAVPGLLPLAGG